MDALQNTGLQDDCPFSLEEGAEPLSPESVQEVPDEAFVEYAGRLNSYLQARTMPLLHCVGLEHIKKPSAYLRDRCHNEMKLSHIALCLVPPQHHGLVCVPSQERR